MATAFQSDAFQFNAFQIDETSARSGVARLQLIELYEREWAERRAKKETPKQAAVVVPQVVKAARQVLRKMPEPLYQLADYEPAPLPPLEPNWHVVAAAVEKASKSVALAREVVAQAFKMPEVVRMKIRRSPRQLRRRREDELVALTLIMEQ